MASCPNCHADIPDPTMRFCAWCEVALPAAERREGNEVAVCDGNASKGVANAVPVRELAREEKCAVH